MVGAVGLVIASSYFFGSADTTMAAGKEPTLLDRITGIFGSKSDAKEAPESQASAEGGPTTEAPPVDPASIAQATQSIPLETIDTGESPANSAAGQTITQAGVSSSLNAGTVTGGAASGNRGKTSAASSGNTPKDIGSSAAALANLGAGGSGDGQPTPSAGGSGASGSGQGGYSAPVSSPRLDPKELEQTRDFFAKLGIRAGTIQESARKLTEEQSNMGMTLRADIRASIKRMEYLMDRAEAAINNQDLPAAKAQMEYAEREIEKLEKFFRI
jgi:hypothetical protein